MKKLWGFVVDTVGSMLVAAVAILLCGGIMGIVLILAELLGFGK